MAPPPRGDDHVPAAPAHAAGVGSADNNDPYQPLNGSWVAELEDAKAKLAAALRSSSKNKEETNDAAAADDEDATVLQARLRVCRAYAKLRQWDQLLEASQRGMTIAAPKIAASSSSTSSPTTTTALTTMASFRQYRKMAKTELQHKDLTIHKAIRHCVLNGGIIPEGLTISGGAISIRNETVLYDAVLMKGDLRLMELAVALGYPIDAPVPEWAAGDRLAASVGASTLVLACAYATFPGVAGSPHEHLYVQVLDRVAECAMQLVRLGADLTLTMPEEVDWDVRAFWPFRGMTPLEIAATSDVGRCRPLVELIREHMQMTAKERADVVHCRCGSRLPWKQCHAVGLGQPSHYVVNSKSKKEVFFRFSPHGRCPCRTTNKTYYECCWTDNRVAVYLNDKTEEFLCRKVDAPIMPSLHKCLKNLARRKRDAARALRALKDGDSSWITSCARLFPNHPALFAALCKDVGPKSQMATWDAIVYAGCVERLEVPFLWRDVHWDLDRAVLVHRVQEWNGALHEYCDDAGLVDGPERDRIVRVHSAYPCGPCGCEGCSAAEGQIKEFRRCSGCKTIAYCSRACQVKDWAVHKQACQLSSANPADGPELVRYERNGKSMEEYPASVDVPTPAAAAGVDTDSYKPLNGSWVAELEDAKEALTDALRSSKKKLYVGSNRVNHVDGPTLAASNNDEEGAAVLQSYLRLCRAHAMLRQWDRLLDVSQEGMIKAMPGTAASVPSSRTISTTLTSLRRYRKTAKAEQQHEDAALHKAIQHCVLNGGAILKELAFGVYSSLPNASVMQEAVVKGDLRLMELAVALGSPIDAITEEFLGSGGDAMLPVGTSVLVVACSFLAHTVSLGPDSEGPITPELRDGVAECAMQLVRLGADPTRVMPPDLQCGRFDRFRGKTAFQIAAISKRGPLIALMWAHMQMSPEERAEVVQCRCGSRLPWKMCHSTGVGQPPHCIMVSKTNDGVTTTTREMCYRVSPYVRCPCLSTNKTFYDCCWTDKRVPAYLDDSTGNRLHGNVDDQSLTSVHRCLTDLAAGEPLAEHILRLREEGDINWTWPYAHLCRTHPSLLSALCDDAGPKSRMTEWDPHVYASCGERVDSPFLWKDVNWDLDRAVLCRHAQEWNDALLDYCDEAGLKGAERDHVVRIHTANPCGPCGYIDCSAFEGYIREFWRCAGCRAISYCSPTCQQKDWAVHKNGCRQDSANLVDCELVLMCPDLVND